jgi:hypothetical protein
VQVPLVLLALRVQVPLALLALRVQADHRRTLLVPAQS